MMGEKNRVGHLAVDGYLISNFLTD
jgi:hypothetical protein